MRLSLTQTAYILLAVLFMSAVALHAKTRAERDRLRSEVALQSATIFALNNDMRILQEDAERTAAARPALPNEDSLRAIIRDDLYKEIKKEGWVLTGGTELEIDNPDTTLTGIEGGFASVPDTLRYVIDRETWVASFQIGLAVYPKEDTLEYTISFDPKPQNFRFYTVERTIDANRKTIEVWVDVPGRLESLRSFILPSALPPPDPPKTSQNLYVGVQSLVTMGKTPVAIAGPEFGFEARWRALHFQIDAGFDLIGKQVFTGAAIGIKF